MSRTDTDTQTDKQTYATECITSHICWWQSELLVAVLQAMGEIGDESHLTGSVSVFHVYHLTAVQFIFIWLIISKFYFVLSAFIVFCCTSSHLCVLPTVLSARVPECQKLKIVG